MQSVYVQCMQLLNHCRALNLRHTQRVNCHFSLWDRIRIDIPGIAYFESVAKSKG